MAALILLIPLGIPELLVILAIILVIFGASKLPQLGRGLGEGIRNFKKGLQDDEKALDDGSKEHETGSSPPRSP